MFHLMNKNAVVISLLFLSNNRKDRCDNNHFEKTFEKEWLKVRIFQTITPNKWN